MRANVDPGLVRLFGSENRALTLAILANSSVPMTACRVAKVSGGQKIKVGAELRRLAEAGFVRERKTDTGRSGWTVDDPNLRSLLRRRLRIVSSAEWNDEVGERIRRRTGIPKIEIDLSRYPPNPSGVPNRDEFIRPPEKDLALAAAGLRTSRRSRIGKRRPPTKSDGFSPRTPRRKRGY